MTHLPFNEILKKFIVPSGLIVDEETASWTSGETRFVAYYSNSTQDDRLEDAVDRLIVYSPKGSAIVASEENNYIISGTRSDVGEEKSPEGFNYLGRGFEVSLRGQTAVTSFLIKTFGIQIPANESAKRQEPRN